MISRTKPIALRFRAANATSLYLAINQISHRRSLCHSNLCSSVNNSCLAGLALGCEWDGSSEGMQNHHPHCVVSALSLLRSLDSNFFAVVASAL